MPLDPVFHYTKKFASIRGSRMAYVDEGKGDPIVFLHGNPTSSYLWRNIIPHLEHLSRCIAPDLIGMGDSDKLPDSGPDRYRISEHAEYLDALFDTLGLNQNVTLVLNDWGSALGFDWARRHPASVKGIAYMEAIVMSYPNEMFPEGEFIDRLRGPEGEKMVLEQNLFIDEFLPSLIIRKLSETEMEAYRRPYREPGEGRRSMLTMPREIPVGGMPAHTHEMVSRYSQWMKSNDIPKLLVNAEPGAAISGPMRDFCRTWPNQEEVTVKGLHFVQEDSPDEIGHALADWYSRL